MLTSAIAQYREKEQRRLEEEKMENDFKKKLMEKFCEDERLEQYNAMRRKQKEIELKKEVKFDFQDLKNKYRLRGNGKKNSDNISYRKNKKLRN